MKKIHKKALEIVLPIFLTLIVAFNIIFFLVPFNKDFSTESFWICYLVTMVLLIFVPAVIVVSIGRKDLKSRVFGFPIFVSAYLTLIAQVIFDILVFSIGNFYTFPLWITIVFETLLLSFCLISLVAKKVYRDMILSPKPEERDVGFVSSVVDEIKTMMQHCENKELYKNLNSLYENIKYTVPFSLPQVEEIENMIFEKLEKLKSAVIKNDKISADELILEIRNLIEKRKTRF